MYFGPKLCGVLLPTCQTRSHSSMALYPCSCLSRANTEQIHAQAHMHAEVKCTHTNIHTHIHTTLPPALDSQFGSLKIKMTIRSHNFWMRLLKRRWAAEDFTSAHRSVLSESQRFNMRRRASNSWSTVKHTHIHKRTDAAEPEVPAGERAVTGILIIV